MILRPYQEKIITEARQLMSKGRKSLLIWSPTGSGKTALTANMIKTAAERGFKCMFLVHRRELIKQSMRTFYNSGVSHGVIANGFTADPTQAIQIASVQTLQNRLNQCNQFNLIVYDEAHHVGAKSWNNVINHFPAAFHIGLSATPERLDGKGLRPYFSEIVYGPSIEWLIENKYLSPYKLFAPSSISLEGVHTRGGDYVKSEITKIVDKPTITGDAVREYQRRAYGKRAVVFACSVQHSEHVVAHFNAAGIPSEHVDGETPSEERDAAIERFERGETLVLSNVDLFGEGFDLPSIECAILLRPTQSLGLYIQQVGRSLRPSPGKSEAIILDHAGNCARHGLPDEPREWNLDGRSGREKRSMDSGPSVKICPRCFAAQKSGSIQCQYCGMGFEIKPRDIEEVDGELIEIDKDTLRKQQRQEQGRAQTLEDLIVYGKAKGYKRPELWARHVYMARQAKLNKRR